MARYFSLQSKSFAIQLLLFLLLLLISSCQSHSNSGTAKIYLPHPVSFDTGQVQIITGSDTHALEVELAIRPEQLAYGLMERSQLPMENGMLFLFKKTQPASAGFWMYRTRIPLDIAYINNSGRIVSIQKMDPCTSSRPEKCATYTPGKRYSAALEVNHGFFVSKKVKVGDRVLIPSLGNVKG